MSEQATDRIFPIYTVITRSLEFAQEQDAVAKRVGGECVTIAERADDAWDGYRICHWWKEEPSGVDRQHALSVDLLRLRLRA